MKTNRYLRRMCFVFDKKQLNSLLSITGGSNFVPAKNGEKNHRSWYYQDESLLPIYH